MEVQTKNKGVRLCIHAVLLCQLMIYCELFMHVVLSRI